MTDLVLGGAPTGSLRTEPAGRAGVHFERLYDATPAELWAALTEPEQLRGWLAELPGLELEPERRFELRFATGGSVSHGVVREVDPGRVLEWAWLHDTGPHSVVRFELQPRDAGCLLVLDHRLLEAEQSVGYGAGWQAHLDALEALLRGDAPVDAHARFLALRARWQQQRDELARGFGQIRPDGDTRALVFERTLDAPAERVWSAITERNQLARWLTATTIEPRVGGAVVVDWGDDGRTTGEVLVWEPPLVLELTWVWEGVLDAVLRLDLLPDGAATHLRLEHRRLRPDLAWDLGSGWHAFLDGLAEVVEGREVGSWADRERAVRSHYERRASAL